MAAGTTTFGRRGYGRWIGVEAAVGAEANHHRNGGLSQRLGQLGRVVAGIKDEQRRCTIPREAVEQVLDLVHRDHVGVLTRMHPSHIKRGGPAVSRETQPS
jgi:hypothetical protein